MHGFIKRRKPTSATSKEKAIEKYLRDIVKLLRGECIKLNPEWNAGIPDRLVILPGRVIFFVECKRPKGGKISARQTFWRNIILKLDLDHYFVKSKEEIDAVIRGYGFDIPIEIMKGKG